MIEKRFVHKNESIIDTQTDELVNASSEEGAEIITAWLNELFEDCNDLKKENYGNLDGINYYQEQNGHLESRISDLECENEQLKQQISDSFNQSNCITVQKSIISDLKKENEQLKHQNELLSDELLQCKAVINKKWSEYLKKKELKSE